MGGLVIGWRYLTGYAVATDPTRRDRVEWPPHPGRVFLALAAAWFETAPEDEDDPVAHRDHAAEGDALRWLEAQDEPELWLPQGQDSATRSLVTAYVPVNDKAGPAKATLQCLPTVTRSKQPRLFPKRHVGEEPCAQWWPEANPIGHLAALERLCGKVTRIGHSSSLVAMWAAVGEPEAALDGALLERWQPSGPTASGHCRVVSPGLLDALPEQTQIDRIEAFAIAKGRIEDAQRAVERAKAKADKVEQRAAKKEQKAAEDDYKGEFGVPWKKTAEAPPRLRPRLAQWVGYHRAGPKHQAPVCGTHFDTDLLVLTRVDGPRLPLSSTYAVTSALRRRIMDTCGMTPKPPWLTGHRVDGPPAAEGSGHLAVLPLPFVGHRHADGHLMGVAVAFPASVPRDQRGRALGPLLVDDGGAPLPVELDLHGLGTWTLRKRDWDDARRALLPEAWTAAPKGCQVWASVTPVVLDRFPKADRRDPRQKPAWEAEVIGLIVAACARIGLPEPVHVDIDTSSWQLGSPRAVVKGRRLRLRQGVATGRQASLGEGFPRYPAKGENGPRPQVHVFLAFAEPVVGPIVIGAGRYRGYGLCKPLEGRA